MSCSKSEAASAGYHSDYRTVTPYWVLPVYVELIQADDGDRPLLFWRKWEALLTWFKISLLRSRNSLFTKQTVWISATAPAAVQIKGTWNKKVQETSVR
jgi:hypothetical protein